jgi:hypothetical protein
MRAPRRRRRDRLDRRGAEPGAVVGPVLHRVRRRLVPDGRCGGRGRRVVTGGRPGAAQLCRLVPPVRRPGDGGVDPFDGLPPPARGGAGPVLGDGTRVVPRAPCGRRGRIARWGAAARGRRRRIASGRCRPGGPPCRPAGGLLPPGPRRDRRHGLAGGAVADRRASGGGRSGGGLLPWSRRGVGRGMDGGDPRDVGVVRPGRRVVAAVRGPVRPALCVPAGGLGSAALRRRSVRPELVGGAGLAAGSVTLGSVGPPSGRRRSSRAQCLSSNNIPAGASGPKLAATTYCGGRDTLPGLPPQGDITAGSAITASGSGPTPTRRP